MATGGSGGSCRQSRFHFAVFSLPTTKATRFSAIAALAVNSMQIREVQGHACVYRKPYPSLSNDRIGQVGAMIALVCFVLAILTSPFKSKSRLETENAALRHQLIVLRRKLRGRAQLTSSDRWFFAHLYRWFPSILQVFTIARPETLVGWYRAGFAAIGVGNHKDREGDRRLMQSCVG